MHRRPLPSFPLRCPRAPASPSGRMVGRALVAVTTIAALASSTAAFAATTVVAPADASAGAPAPASASPLILDVIHRASRAAASAATGTAPAPTVNSAPTGFGAPGMNVTHTLPTALSNLRATVTPSTANRVLSLTAPANPYAAQSKHPGTEGFAGDQYGHALSTTGDMNGDGVSDVAVGAFQAFGPAGMTGEVVYYYGTPSLSTPPTTIYGEQAFDEFGYSVAGVGDVNGDGYPDLLVGAPLHDVGANVDAGKAYLYLGSPAGIATVPTWVFSPGEAHARVGWSVAWAGDVNNDGYDDWIVGAPGHSNGESAEGAAYLFLGGPGLLSNVPAWSYEPNVANAEFGSSVATAGDVNGDGYADLVVGAPYLSDSFTNEGKAYLFFGHSSKPSLVPDASWEGGQGSAYFGFSVAAAGDVDGDGYGDVIIGAPYYDDPTSNQGEAMIVYGGPNPLLFRTPSFLLIDQLNGYFGWSVSTAGDVNGDGYADVIVGAVGIPQTVNQGEAFIFVGSPYGIIPSFYNAIVSPDSNEVAGTAVGTMGDFLYSDGFSECWTGSPGPGSGEAWLLPGRPYTPGGAELNAAQGYVANRYSGTSVAAADVNGDGFDDLIVGSDQSGANAQYDGEANVYYGGPNPFQSAGPYPFLAPFPDWTVEGDDPAYLGWTVANAGDVNGDGYQDFITGAPFHSNAFSAEGEAKLFYGSSTGPQGGSPWRVEGVSAAALMGYGLGAGGDLNGDGYDDVAVGTPQGDKGIGFEGLVNVYYGSQFGLAHTPAIVLRGNQSAAYMGTSCPIVGDINGDGYDDLVVGAEGFTEGEANEGHAYVYFGSPTGIHSVADQTLQINVADAHFGFSIYRIGDVNGDGYADVAIDAPGISDPESQEGELLVYYGSPSGLEEPAAWTLEGDQADNDLGETGISGADVNADGISDLVVGEPNSDFGGSKAGRLRVFLGSTGGLDTSPYLTEWSTTANDNFGFATGGEGDFDGDGFPDLYYTEPGLALVSASEGGAYVRLGNSIWPGTRNPAKPLGTWRADDSAPVQPGLRSDSQTAFRLKGRARSSVGRTRLRLESEVKPVSVPFALTGHTKSSWQFTGPVAAGAGSSAPMDVALTGLTPATKYHWRARYQTKSLFFPVTPWFSTEQRNASERHLSTAGAPGAVDVPPAPVLSATEVALAPPAPNPSVGSGTSLVFSLPTPGAARLALYDLRGALIRTLFDAKAAAGTTRVTWDGLDAHGRRAPAGAYFMRLTALGKERVVKLVRLD